jgi:hypothetical protein
MHTRTAAYRVRKIHDDAGAGEAGFLQRQQRQRQQEQGQNETARNVSSTRRARNAFAGTNENIRAKGGAKAKAVGSAYERKNATPARRAHLHQTPHELPAADVGGRHFVR